MEMTEKDIQTLERQLDDFDQKTRKNALQALVEAAEAETIRVKPMQEVANLHCHSFFSYNGYGYSPSHLAWLGKKHGIKFMGVVDFDVLDAVDEFLDACETTCVRGVAGIETRVFIPEFDDAEINSPGEPGILYHMGTGFTTTAVPDKARDTLFDLSQRAAERNRDVLKRINQFLAPFSVDYDADVLPLTPAGNATERHMVQVLAQKSIQTMKDPAGFWADKLGVTVEEAAKIMQDNNQFKNFLRAKLMKRGGVGYVRPTAASFPTVDTLHTLMKSTNSLPCAAWLDGTSDGEQRYEELLALLIEKGASALNIVPDRNWNIADPDVKKDKLQKLYDVVALANEFHLPVLVGTEMNKFGQKFVDDFNAPELDPVKDTFLKGAEILYGHTQLQRYWEIGYQSAWAQTHFFNRNEKANFYQQAGQAIQPGHKKGSDELKQYDPEAVLVYINNN